MKRLFFLLLLLASQPVFAQTATIRLEDLSVKIRPLMPIMDPELHDKQVQKHARVIMELADALEGATITLHNTSLSQISIYMRYETSLSISREGPHCDLLDWKHFLSPWKRLSQEGKLRFVAARYTDEERQKFPLVNNAEMKAAVARKCEGWEELLDGVTSPTQYPARVGISKYILRIVGTDKVGKRVHRYITFEMPMGC